MTIVGIAARRYATALLEVAAGVGKAERCLRDLQSFDRAVARITELRDAIVNPSVPSDAVSAVVAATARAMHLDELTVAFLALLGSRRRMAELKQVIAAYAAEQERRAGREKGELVSAGILTPAQVNRIREAVGKALGRKVVLTQKTDPWLLGGLKVTVGDMVFDLSTRAYLESLRSQLLEGR